MKTEEAVLKANKALWDAIDAYLKAVIEEAGTEDLSVLHRIVSRGRAGGIINKALIRTWLEERGERR